MGEKYGAAEKEVASEVYEKEYENIRKTIISDDKENNRKGQESTETLSKLPLATNDYIAEYISAPAINFNRSSAASASTAAPDIFCFAS